MDFRMSYLFFADVKDYSKLKETEIATFSTSIVPDVVRKIREHAPSYVNMWGDAFMCVFPDPVRAADCSLMVRDYFRWADWDAKGLPKLDARVSLHAGRTATFLDPLTGADTVCGRAVTLAARIEPVVPAGEVFTTDLMISTLQALGRSAQFAWDSLGSHPLAKHWGAERLYRLRRPGEASTTLRDLNMPEILNLFRITHENDLRDERMQAVLTEDCMSIALLALSGFSYLHPEGKNWRFGVHRHLAEGRPMRVILMHPDGEEAKVRRKSERRRKDRPFLLVSLSRLEELAEEYASLELRLTRAPIYCSLFFTSQSVFYDPYHLGSFPGQQSGQNQFVVIEFRRGHSYDLLESHFEFLWNAESTFPLAEVAQDYRREIGG
jgi:class 3 adenylate cyclase